MCAPDTQLAPGEHRECDDRCDFVGPADALEWRSILEIRQIIGEASIIPGIVVPGSPFHGNAASTQFFRPAFRKALQRAFRRELPKTFSRQARRHGFCTAAPSSCAGNALTYGITPFTDQTVSEMGMRYDGSRQAA
jgi:hypothetical protein